MAALELRDVHRTFQGPPTVQALRAIDLDIEEGEFLAVVGPSGGGKSTLLNVIGLLDRPDEGEYRIEDVATDRASEAELARIRSSTFGFVFQGFHLLDHRPVTDSVELGLLYRALPPDERRRHAETALDAVGLRHLADQRAANLSGGQRQRVAIARALAAATPVLVADEPTGNLDSENGQRIVDALRALNERGTTVVLVTHDMDVARVADRIAHIRDGRIERIERTGSRSRSAPRTPGGPPGRPSKVRIRDVVRDASRSLLSRVSRTLGLAAAVATAVTLAVTTFGVTASASAQVSDRFDRHANRDVAVAWDNAAVDVMRSDLDEDLAYLGRQATSLNGVDSAGLLMDVGSIDLQGTPRRPTVQAPAALFTPGVVPAARLTIRWVGGRARELRDGDVLVGRGLAAQVPLGPLAGSPSISVGDREMAVVGVIERSPRVPSLLGAVLAAPGAAASFEDPSRTRVLMRTAPGAAQVVAKQAPYAIHPEDVDALSVDAPADPTTLRAEIEDDVQSTLLAFTALAMVASVVALANAMIAAVLERRAEFGLRRAIGARRSHVSWLVITEASLIGAVGGAAGLIVGLAVIVGITVHNRWSPVFDLWTAPLAVIGGIAVGALGGFIAALRASRIEPQDALRQ